MFLNEIRYSPRSPMEIGLCSIKWLPSKALQILENRYGTFPKDSNFWEWFSVQEEKYSYIGDWLANWRLGMREPAGERAALWSNFAAPIDRFIDVCEVLVRAYPELSDELGDGAGVKAACRALLCDFFAQFADSGMGHYLGIPGYPAALLEGKEEQRRRMVAALKSVGAKPGNRSNKKAGRPPGFKKQQYPSECLCFDRVVRLAHAYAKKDKSFRDGFYADWLNAMTAMNTATEDPTLQIGLLAGEEFFITQKGKAVPKGFATKSVQKRRSPKIN